MRKQKPNGSGERANQREASLNRIMVQVSQALVHASLLCLLVLNLTPELMDGLWPGAFNGIVLLVLICNHARLLVLEYSSR